MKRLLFLFALSFQAILAQSEVIVTPDSVMVFTTKSAWKQRQVPQGYQALYLPPRGQYDSTKKVLRHLAGIPVAWVGVMLGAGVISRFKECRNCPTETENSLENEGHGFVWGGMGASLAYATVVVPSMANLAYKDRKRALIGGAIRVTGAALLLKSTDISLESRKGITTVGLGLFSSGIVYSLYTAHLSRRDYNQKRRKFGIIP
jgi:hypothetical protein